jgi:hypothetical protein
VSGTPDPKKHETVWQEAARLAEEKADLARRLAEAEELLRWAHDVIGPIAQGQEADQMLGRISAALAKGKGT